MTDVSEQDRQWMRRAIALAWNGWGRVAPNPLVGCVLVRDDGHVVGEGWHAEYGGPHAEVEALRAAGDAARGATAYVSLEPCSHHGKTPPCTDALIAAGMRRVVFGGFDPNPRAAGGAQVLREAGIDAVGGVEEAAVRDQNAVFFHAHAEGAARPFVALKLAMSLDARIADRDGRSVWITGEEARAETHRLRAGYDAVAVGVGTAVADDPMLTVRGAVQPRVPPARVVFDRTLRLPPDGKLALSAREIPVWAVCEPDAPLDRRAALEEAGVRVLAAAGLAAQLRALGEAGVRSMFVEGGSVLASALLAAGAVDRMYLFYAPVLIGPDGAAPFAGIPGSPLADAPRWRRIDTQSFGADTLITLART